MNTVQEKELYATLISVSNNLAIAIPVIRQVTEKKFLEDMKDHVDKSIDNYLSIPPSKDDAAGVVESLKEMIKTFDKQALAHFDREAFMVMERAKQVIKNYNTKI